jgi:CTP:phosphocholine cytidylyltransferase-like protein
MIKVDNAILMAAGASSRMVPLSYECPKALLNIRGEILIERQIRQLQERGIKEIVVVLGYQKEKFYYLKEKYGVILLENNDYKVRNNHSTLYVARNYLKNSYICCVDIYYAQNLFQSEEEHSYYSVQFVQGETDEWCVNSNEQNLINHVTVGGHDAWVMIGHAFFSEQFSKTLVPYLEKAYHNPEDANTYWEDIYLQHMDEMDLYVKRYDNGLMLEFDSLQDLRVFDKRYAVHSGSLILEDLSKRLNCIESEIIHIKPIKYNAEAVGFSFQYNGIHYNYLYNTKELYQKQSSLIAS